MIWTKVLNSQSKIPGSAPGENAQEGTNDSAETFPHKKNATNNTHPLLSRICLRYLFRKFFRLLLAHSLNKKKAE